MVPLLILIMLIGIPIAEISIFIQVGDWIGLWPTLAMVVITALVGTALLRQQGLSVLNRLRATLARDELPVVELFDGACLLVAGVALLTPGFLTDVLGFFLFLPPVRAAIALVLLGWLSSRIDVRTPPGPGSGPGSPRSAGGAVIDADYKDVTSNSHRTGQDKDRLT
jgi:UPF0716 protein FxsA